ncbi:uncharacterized protein LOC114250479 [Bombyx mandarina]|uniref:Uncharacterized protein LOC114250479 n=1 Tax=Bombyx mandarina TaxID=7092 RepID=A0A6J2KIY3_BOMMA|nr:uncharacterized protein LOC114250479 [Bombyx mandarina]
MYYKFVLIPTIVFIPFFILDSRCHIPKNNSDVFVTYEGHAEVNEKAMTDVKLTPNVGDATNAPNVTDDVIFVPNSAERNVDRFNIDEIITKKTIGDFLERQNVNFETEAPKDVLFIKAKNNEDIEKTTKAETRRHGTDTKKLKIKSLNCAELDCNNTQDSVCGSKFEHKQLKYRLFLNECYFRKVNCGFKHEINRYQQVDLGKCNNTAARYNERPLPFKPIPVKSDVANWNNTRRFGSRRSLSMGINGQYCTHTCPASCPDSYDPQCAVSQTGQKKVFANHCKMDYNSCLYGVAWYMRPLSECVGGKKADLQQNRAFVNWMQRVGIVDNKGRLVLS